MLEAAGGGSNGAPIPTTAEGLLPSGNVQPPPTLDEDGKESSGMKANKGIILRKSVEYIRFVYMIYWLFFPLHSHFFPFSYLQQLVRVQASRNRELESELSRYRVGSSSDVTPSPPANGNPAHGDTLSPYHTLDGMNGMSMLNGSEDEDTMSMSGILANMSPEDTTGFASAPGNGMSNGQMHLKQSPNSGMNGKMLETSPSAASIGGSEEEEEQERGRAVERRGRFAGGGIPATSSVSVGKSMNALKRKTMSRDDSALSETEEMDMESSQ